MSTVRGIEPTTTRLGRSIPQRRLDFRRTDVLPVMVAGVALVTFALHGFLGRLSHDLGVYTYAGQQVADGVPPYLGILNRAGPLAHILPGSGVVVARLVGIDDVLGMRLLFLAFAVVSVALVYVVGRDLFASRLAGLVAAASFLSFEVFIKYASNGPREKTPMVLFLVCLLWAITKRRWFTAGVFIALATLTLQTAFLGAMAAAVVAVWAMRTGERLSAFLRILAGGLVVTAGFAGYFAAVGAFAEFYEAFFWLNFDSRYASASPIYTAIGESWREVRAAYGASLGFFLGGLLALAVLTVVALRHVRRDSSKWVVVAVGAGALGALLVLARDFDNGNDTYPLIPMAALGMGGAGAWLVKRVSRRVAVLVTACVIVTCEAVALTYSVTERDNGLETQRRQVAAVFGQLPGDATIMSAESAIPLVLAGHTNPTRILSFGGGFYTYLDDTYPGGFDGFTRWFKAQEPTLVSVGGHKRARWRRILSPDYVVVGWAPGWTWLARRDLGPAVLSDLRRASRTAGR